MTSKHYKWQTRWTIDPASKTATHGPTGLVVRFDSLPGTPANADSVHAALLPVNGRHNSARMIVRLACEANTLWEQCGNISLDTSASRSNPAF